MRLESRVCANVRTFSHFRVSGRASSGHVRRRDVGYTGRSESEIADFRIALGVNKHIRELDIPMYLQAYRVSRPAFTNNKHTTTYNPEAGHVHQRFQDLVKQTPCLVLLKPLLNPLLERLLLDKLLQMQVRAGAKDGPENITHHGDV